MAEGTRLESVRTLTRTAGSNPALSAKMNPTEPVKRLKLGFIFLCSEYEFKSQANSKRDLNPRYYFLYDLRLSVDLMLNFFYLQLVKFPYFNCLSSVVCITRQREYQLHRENKYLKIECLSKSQARIRVWLFFYFNDTFFRCGFNLFVDILNGNRISTLSAFRLVILLQCRKAKLNMEVSLR